MPVELDVIERRLRQLEMERQAVKKDGESSDRLKKIEKEIADLKEESKGLHAHWQKEKEIISAVRKTKEEIETLKTEGRRADRRQNDRR